MSKVPLVKLSSGNSIPQIGLGTWQTFGGGEPGVVKKIVKMALDLGYRHFDTAAVYLNEEEVGEAIAEAIAAGQVKREDLFITTKLWNTCHAPEHVEPSLRLSLKKLQMDYVDLYLIHFPLAWEFTTLELNPKAPGLDEHGIMKRAKVPLIDTWRAMEALVPKGLTKAVGVSNFTVQSLLDLVNYDVSIPAVCQIEIHPQKPQVELVDFCQQMGIHVTGYSLFGSNGKAMLSLEPVVTLANKYKTTPGKILLRWAVDRGISVVPKSTNAERLATNLEIESFKLTAEEIASINACDKNKSVFDRVEMGWGYNPFA